MNMIGLHPNTLYLCLIVNGKPNCEAGSTNAIIYILIFVTRSDSLQGVV